jgi:hypothetical protein
MKKYVFLCRAFGQPKLSTSTSDSQRATVQAFVAHQRGTLVGEFVEVAVGRTVFGQEVRAALVECRRQEATLVLAGLDGTALEMINLRRLMENNDVPVVVASHPSRTKNQWIAIGQAHAEQRKNRSDLIKAGLNRAKEAGTKLGNAALNSFKGVSAERRTVKADDFTRLMFSEAQRLRQGSMGSRPKTFGEISKYFNDHGFDTARGGRWFPSTVKRLIERGQRLGLNENGSVSS